MPRTLLIAGLLLLCAGCRAFPGHPVRLSEVRVPDAPRAAVEHLPDTPAAGDAEAEALHFRGLEGVLAPLRDLRQVPIQRGRTPRLVRLRRMEKSVRKRYRRGGFGGPVRAVVAVAVLGWMPLQPAEAADLICDPRVERAVLGANRLWQLDTVYALPGVRRERYRVELLNRGAGPIRYDLRFTQVLERRETPAGRVLLRMDPDVRPRPEHVTLFRQGCLLEPEAGGTRVTEITILGTDIQVLPLFQAQMTKLSLKTLHDRATNLWIRAWRGK